MRIFWHPRKKLKYNKVSWGCAELKISKLECLIFESIFHLFVKMSVIATIQTVLLLLFLVKASSTNSTPAIDVQKQRTQIFALLSTAQRLRLTLDVNDTTASVQLYRSICQDNSTPADLRALACDLQYDVPATSSTVSSTVVGPSALAQLSSRVEIEIEQIRRLDIELATLSLRETLQSDSAKMWLQLDGSIADSASYTAEEVKETLDLRTSYRNIVSGLNSNISTSLDGVRHSLSEAHGSLNSRIAQLQKDSARQSIVGHIAEFAHGVLFVANLATGIACSGWSSSEELTKMRAEDAAKAAAKEAKDNAGLFKTWLSLIKGEHSQAGAHSSDDALTASIDGIIQQCETQLDVLEGISTLMSSMQAIASSSASITADSADRPMLLDALNQTISSLSIQSTADSLVGSLQGTESGSTVDVRAKIDSFAGLVRARASAINGFWNTNNKLRVLEANTAMLTAQHMHLAQQINDTQRADERAVHATTLLRAHRMQRVNAVTLDLQRMLYTSNFVSGTVREMQPFAQLSRVNSDLNTSTSMGVMPTPGTAALASRHAEYISLIAQGFVVPIQAKKSVTKSASSTFFHLSCWKSFTLTKNEIDLDALRRGEVVGFPIRFNPDTPVVMSTVSAVRACK